MNQAELIAHIAKKNKLSAREAKEAVQAVLAAIETSLVKGEAVRTTLGTFSVSKRAARTGRNPQTGEAVKIKASKGVRFKVSRTVKNQLNKR
ncbi:MAG TPA: HU family DNA-binding protein [Alphaproteobacteria bacterium]|nr:HU family DNA-binding protein [Alphaproteobacteria bacterium]